MFRAFKVGVVMPALNEEASVGDVVSSLLRLEGDGGQPLVDKVVVCDNGSSDETAQVARSAGAQVVVEQRRGYGIACQRALRAVYECAPDVVVFTDADGAFEANAVRELIEPLTIGYDFVLGTRTRGFVEPGALSWSQRIGNRIATLMIRVLWGVRYDDLGPFRAIRTKKLGTLRMSDPAYGWTVEMQVKAIQAGFRFTEVPVRTRARVGKSKISGTLRGIVGAGIGIVSTILKLWYSERQGRSPSLPP